MDRKIERQKERAAKDNAPRIPSATEQAGLDALQAREKGALCCATCRSVVPNVCTYMSEDRVAERPLRFSAPLPLCGA